jgi:hypothetical protein
MKEKKKMNNLSTIYLFLFIFVTLNILRNVFRFIRALSSTPPQRLILSDKDLILLGVSVSYFLTYLIRI